MPPNLAPRLARSLSTRTSLGLAGTAPAHTAYVLLHTPAPPPTYPPKPAHPLARDLARRARAWGGAVNFAWAPGQRVHPFTPVFAHDGQQEGAEGEAEEEEEAYMGTVFAGGRRAVVPAVSRANLDAVDRVLAALVRGARGEGEEPGLYAYAYEQEEETEAEGGKMLELEAKAQAKAYVYVCTHGARDCRCGESGGAVVRALREEVARRGLGARVVIGEVAHVGGHKYAANVLVYPYGEWLGTIQDVDVPHVLDELLAWQAAHAHAPAHTRPPLCPPFWRGRMGLDSEQQIALYSAHR